MKSLYEVCTILKQSGIKVTFDESEYGDSLSVKVFDWWHEIKVDAFFNAKTNREVISIAKQEIEKVKKENEERNARIAELGNNANFDDLLSVW